MADRDGSRSRVRKDEHTVWRSQIGDAVFADGASGSKSNISDRQRVTDTPDETGVISRRRVLALAGLSVGISVAGCTGGGGNATYDTGEAIDVEEPDRSADELVAAEALAEQDVHEGVTHLDAARLVDHEFVLEDGFEGPTVQGTLENAGRNRLAIAEVRVRVFDADDHLLGRYVDRTGDLDGGDRWAFTVLVLEPPADLSSYDIAALGSPA